MSGKVSFFRSISWSIALLGCGLAQGQDSSQGDAAAQANNPLADSTAFNLHDYYISEFTGLNEDANQFILRFAKPLKVCDSDWLVRASLPINTYPTARGHTTGLGDFNVFAAYLFESKNPAISVGFGPQITMPTASESSLGSEKWSAGFAHVLFNASSKKLQYGYLMTWQASFAGESDRDSVNFGAFQPFVFYQLGNGWYLRNSAVWAYDFESGDYSVPLGLGVGRVIPTDNVVFNAFIEPQYSIFDSGDSFPEWQIFAGFNMQF